MSCIGWKTQGDDEESVMSNADLFISYHMFVYYIVDRTQLYTHSN